MTNEDLLLVNGGGFAYDLGFFIRELIIYAANGGNGPGTVAVATDLGSIIDLSVIKKIGRGICSPYFLLNYIFVIIM